MNKQQSIFSIGWIFACIAAIVLGLLIFFSLNFQYLGERIGLNIFLATIYAVLLLGVVAVLVKSKKESIPLNFRKAATIEFFMLFVYCVIVLIGVICTNHFYVVMSKKDTIKQELTKQIGLIDDMFDSYNKNVEDRVAAYDAYLQQVESTKNSNYSRFVNEQLNQYSREDLVINFKGEIDCGDVQQSIEDWKAEMLSKTNGLGLITLMPRVNEINDNLTNTLERLKELDRTSDKGLNGPHWDYTLTVSNNILKKFEFQKGEPISIWAIIVIIVLALIILLPYIAADRDGRNKGLIWELTHKREQKGI